GALVKNGRRRREKPRAAGGMGAEQRALGTLQNLYALQVIKIAGSRQHRRDFREIGCDAGEVALAGCENAGPLSAKIKIRLIAAQPGDIEARCDLAQIVDRTHPELLELISC